MSDIKLFSTNDGKAIELAGSSVALEKSVQTLIEENLEPLLGLRFVASEYSTGKKHGGRIDSLAVDENVCPVIIEYKRATNENVINQGLFYLDWLLDHKAEFQLRVQEQLGSDVAESLDWSAPRLLCIAGGFTRYDEHAVQQMNRNIELIRYVRFAEDLLLLELVNASSAEVVLSRSTAVKSSDTGGTSGTVYKTMSETLNRLEGSVKDLYEELRAYLLAMGDDVQEKVLKTYVAFKRIKNFACVEVRASKESILIFLKIDPDEAALEVGFTRDVREIGHWGTGDLEVTLRDRSDLERAKALIEASYQAN